MSTKILLADDHGIVRESLRAMLRQKPDIEVVGEAEDGRKAVSLVQELVPDIVVMDISMPNLNGVDATRQIVSEFPNVKVIAMSMHSDRQFIAEMLKAGASGYLLKDCSSDELVKAIRTVAAGGMHLSTRAVGSVVDDYVELLLADRNSSRMMLTEREREVLQLIAEGKSTKQIALELCVSDKAIEATRRKIMDKLGLYSIAELTKYAICEGLTSIH